MINFEMDHCSRLKLSLCAILQPATRGQSALFWPHFFEGCLINLVSEKVFALVFEYF